MGSEEVSSNHHGAAGIGGGYEGHASVQIAGDCLIESVAASGGAAGIGSGSTSNTNPNRGDNGRSPDAVLKKTTVLIDGGTIQYVAGGRTGGAGIGGGFGADYVDITISGGTVVEEEIAGY